MEERLYFLYVSGRICRECIFGSGRLAVNGMSYSGRDGQNANSAVIVTVTPEDYGTDDVLAGMAFQRKLEEAAYRAGEGKIPVQLFEISVR